MLQFTQQKLQWPMPLGNYLQVDMGIIDAITIVTLILITLNFCRFTLSGFLFFSCLQLNHFKQ